MSVPNVLLLTGTPPSLNDVGGIFLSDLCKYYPKEHLCCFATCDDKNGSLPQELSWLPIAYNRHPRDQGVLRFGQYLASLSSIPIHQYVKHIQIPKLVEQSVTFGKKHGVDLVWAVLDRIGIIYIAREVADKLGAQLVTLVWDPPEYWITERHSSIDKFSYHSILSEFKNVMRMAVRCGVVSDGMRDEYEKKYFVKSVILRHGIQQDKWRLPAKELNNERQFTIGFAGSLYAKREWECLLSALSEINWSIVGRDIVLRLMGRNFELESKNKVHIEYFGHCSVEETIDLISKTDIAYLPYWLDESYGLVTRLSFPTKLTTYIASGRPILFHGPEDSSPAHFFKKYPAGLCCHSLDESSIIECLQKFATDREFYAMATAAGQIALHQEFDLRVFLSRFAKLIGIEETELLPLDK